MGDTWGGEVDVGRSIGRARHTHGICVHRLVRNGWVQRRNPFDTGGHHLVRRDSLGCTSVSAIGPNDQKKPRGRIAFGSSGYSVCARARVGNIERGGGTSGQSHRYHFTLTPRLFVLLLAPHCPLAGRAAFVGRLWCAPLREPTALLRESDGSIRSAFPLDPFDTAPGRGRLRAKPPGSGLAPFAVPLGELGPPMSFHRS